MISIDENGHIIREKEPNSNFPSEEKDSWIAKQLKQEPNASPSLSTKTVDDNDALREAITAKIQATREKCDSIVSEEDETAKKRKEIAERLLNGTPNINIEVFENEKKICGFYFSSFQDFVIYAEYKASLSTGILEINSNNGEFIVNNVYSLNDSEIEIYNKSQKALGLLERLSIVFERSNKSICNDNKVKIIDWKDVLEWLDESPIKIKKYSQKKYSQVLSRPLDI